MTLHKTCKYLGYPKMFPFCGSQMDGKLCWVFLLLPSKVDADASMNSSIAKLKWPKCQKCMLSMGVQFILERNTSTKTGYK
jgi:hypothetical protein